MSSRYNGLRFPAPSQTAKAARTQADAANGLIPADAPCHVTAISGQMVTVAFDVTSDIPWPSATIPIVTSECDWLPIAIGTKGIARAAEIDCSFASDMTDVQPTFPGDLCPTLTGLAFEPVASAKAVAPPDPTQRVIQGAGGVRLQPLGAENGPVFNLTQTGITLSIGNASITMADGSITLSVGGSAVAITASGVEIMGRDFLTHGHKGVQTGTSNSGGVV